MLRRNYGDTVRLGGMYPVHKMEDFSGASGKTEYFWPEKNWDVTLKRLRSCNPCSSALRDRSVLDNFAQRGSQASRLSATCCWKGTELVLMLTFCNGRRRN